MRHTHEDTTVMAAVDASEFVIADVDRDGAWLSVGEPEAVVLSEWC